jgi:Sec-independent protein translocase protein TatA
MNLGIWQFLLILLIFVLLFGNFPKILKDVAEGIKSFKDDFKTKE